MNTIAILSLNCVCIVLLLIMTTVLLFGTHLRGGGGFVAAAVFIGTVPSHLFNMFRSLNMFGAANVAWFFSSCNTLLLPLLYVCFRRLLDVNYRFKPKELLHFVPAAVSFVTVAAYFIPMDYDMRVENLIAQAGGYEPTVSVLNDIIIAVQMVVYFPLSFRLTYRFKRIFRDSSSDYDLFQIKWLESFIFMAMSLLVIVMVAYAIHPRTDVWLIPILNIILIAYLNYQCVAHPTALYWEQYKAAYNEVSLRSGTEEDVDETESDTGKAASRYSDDKLSECSDCVVEYIRKNKSYINPDLTVWAVAAGTGFSPILISKSINEKLGKSFFDLINRMRIEEVKRFITEGEADTLTIEAISKRCGFRSRSSFYTAFNKFEHCTPKQWIAENRHRLG